MPDEPQGGDTVAAVERLSDSSLAFEVEFLAVKAASEGTRNANAKLRQFGLKVRSYAVLATAASGAAPSQRDLADFLALDPSQIVALVDELEAKGLVVREVDPRDRRSKVVSATDVGTELWRNASVAAREAEGESLAALSAAEQETLRDLLRRIVFE